MNFNNASDPLETSLPFVVPHYDGRQNWRPLALSVDLSTPVADKVVKHQGRIYLLRVLYHNLVLFRDAARNFPEWTYYLREPLRDEPIAKFTAEQFGVALETGAYGRFVPCMPGDKFGRQTFDLLFSPDGTGVYRGYRETLDFTWDWTQTGMQAPEALFSEHLIELDLFNCRAFSLHCADIIERQISKRLQNPYVDPDEMQDKPLVFACGSEAELKRITLWICHTDPDLFAQHQAQLTVLYTSPSPKRAARRWLLDEGIRNPPYRAISKSPRLKYLLRLANTHNAFSGWSWHYRTRRPRRRNGYRQKLAEVRVEVQPPSAHECANSLLELSDWLYGKVSKKKKLQLLGLD